MTVIVKIINGKVQIVSGSKINKVAGHNVAVNNVPLNQLAEHKVAVSKVPRNKVAASENPEIKSVSKCRVRLLTKQQCQILEKQFSHSIYITRLQKEALAAELNINPIQVAVWFHNRRLCELRKLTNNRKKKPAFPNKPVNQLIDSKKDNLSSTGMKPQVLNKVQQKNETGMQPKTNATPTTTNENIAQPETWGYVGSDFYNGWDLTPCQSEFSSTNFTSSATLDCEFDFFTDF